MNQESLEYKFLEAIYNKIDIGRLKAHVFKEANKNSEITIAIFKKDGIVKIVKLNEKLEKQKLFYGDLMRLLDTAYAGLELKTELQKLIKDLDIVLSINDIHDYSYDVDNGKIINWDNHYLKTLVNESQNGRTFKYENNKKSIDESIVSHHNEFVPTRNLCTKTRYN
mgnify:CR=1 FL=1